jgi:hypothetical protein
MELPVTEVTDDLIVCGGPNGWRFDRLTGIEVDEDLGWGPQFGVSGSFLQPLEQIDRDSSSQLLHYPSGCLDRVGEHGPAYLHAGHASRECALAGVDPGWRGLVDRLYDVVEPARASGGDLAVAQVKQKWGELRVTLRGADAAAVEALVGDLRTESIRTCEGCGAAAPSGPRNVLVGLAYLPRVRTYCDVCFAAARVGEPRRTLQRLDELLREVDRERERPQ